MHCIAFLLSFSYCSCIFLWWTQNTCWPLPFLSANFSSWLSRNLHFLLIWYTGLLPPMNMGLDSLFWQETKKKREFNTFSNTQEGKVRPSSLHRKVHIISYSYWRIEPNSLSSAKTSGKITFIPSLFTCSTKNISFWIYDLLSMTVSHATTPLSCFWHRIWSMDLASLAAAKMMSCFHACLPACSNLLEYC